MSVKHFHYYLYGQRFTIRTDHASLKWLANFKVLEGQLCRWLNVLSTYDYEMVHRPGRLHSNCDALSRRPCYDTNCSYCEKIESRFISDNVGQVCQCNSVDSKANKTETLQNFKSVDIDTVPKYEITSEAVVLENKVVEEANTPFLDYGSWVSTSRGDVIENDDFG